MVDPISFDSYRASMAASVYRAFSPWSRMPPEEWAEAVYRLPNGGRFRWSYAPYTRQMFRSLFDRQTISTAFQLYSRGLKSTVVLLAIGYVIDQAPRRILSLWPTIGQAEKWSKEILCGELLDTTPPLNYLGSATGKRNGSNTILNKQFPGGLIAAFGANSPGEMRRAKGSFLYEEEIDAIEATQTDEGDQLAIFAKRGDEYPDTIRVSASYPSVKGSSRINAKLEASDGNQWVSTCVRCGGEPFVMHRSQLLIDRNNIGATRLECPRCKEQLTDAERYDMAHRQGFDNWRPTREFRGKRGFQANAMLWPHPVDLVKFPGGWLQCMAQQQIDAENSENPRRSLKVLVNTVDAEPFDPTEETEKAPEAALIFARRERYGLTIPMRGLFLTAFVDCQKNRLEVGWRAWGRREESWGMDHVVLDGYVGHPQVWRELRKELSRAFKHESGATMTLGMGFVDGGHYSEDVYRFFQDLARNPEPNVTGHCQASKGMGSHPHVIVTHGAMKTIAKSLKGRHLGTWQAKDRIYERLRMEPTEEERATGEYRDGTMHYNEQYQEEYFNGLTIEKATQKINGAEIYNTYTDKVIGNEPFDIEVGCFGAFRLNPRNFDALERGIMERAAVAKGEKAVAKQPRMRSVAGIL